MRTLLKSDLVNGFGEVALKLTKLSEAKLKVIVCHWFNTMGLIISHCVDQGSVNKLF